MSTYMDSKTIELEMEKFIQCEDRRQLRLRELRAEVKPILDALEGTDVGFYHTCSLKGNSAYCFHKKLGLSGPYTSLIISGDLGEETVVSFYLEETTRRRLLLKSPEGKKSVRDFIASLKG